MSAADFTTRKTVVFGVITVLFVVLVGGAIGEYLLRQQRYAIERSDHMGPGLFGYDRTLGWRMRPTWQVQHRHHDFDVEYKTNSEGFRGEFRQALWHVAVVGDSFTFGFGTPEGKTFTDLLDAADPSRAYLNFGVPGYSTDQEILLVEQVMARHRPYLVLLVVYLGNDLADNMRIFPLQLENAKPYFELTDRNLRLRNIPVPM